MKTSSRKIRSILFSATLLAVHQSRELAAPADQPRAIISEGIDARTVLVRRRVQLNAIIRRATLARNAVPTLATGKVWAKRWRDSHQGPFNRQIKTAKRELETIAKQIGKPPEWWTPRKFIGAARIAKQYRAESTPLQPWAAAWEAEQQERMNREREDAHRVRRMPDMSGSSLAVA